MNRKWFAGVLIVAMTLTFAPAVFAADGAAIFKTKCASCHGPDGAGLTTMGKAMKLRDLGSADVQKQTDKELYDWTAAGKNKMPAYKDKLSTDEINALVTFMRTLKK
jgi:mono/diheme cytochrome c family protein